MRALRAAPKKILGKKSGIYHLYFVAPAEKAHFIPFCDQIKVLDPFQNRLRLEIWNRSLRERTQFVCHAPE